MDKPNFFDNPLLEDFANDSLWNHDMLSRILLAFLIEKGFTTHDEFEGFQKAYIQQFYKSMYPEQF